LARAVRRAPPGDAARPGRPLRNRRGVRRRLVVGRAIVCTAESEPDRPRTRNRALPDVKPLQKVLIANRGEIAVRVIRACKDAGIGSVAVFADTDRDALFVRLAEEAHSLGGAPPADSYLDIAKIVKVAVDTGADSVHPGYGFLAENRAFAKPGIDAGLVWIGPPPEAIESLGDKVKARHIAEKVGAPLVAGTQDPV